MNGTVGDSHELRRLLAAARVVPVVTVRDAGHGLPLLAALAAGGLTTVEVTLRTEWGLPAVRDARRELPDLTVGVGSVSTPAQLAQARSAGAAFAVSPGFTADLATEARREQIPWLPGVATVSEAMQARDLGFDVLKLFPAATVGGTRFLDAVRGPLPELAFCPTGGIDGASYREYLARENVVAVGGSWMVPADALEAGDWERITRSAREVER